MSEANDGGEESSVFHLNLFYSVQLKLIHLNLKNETRFRGRHTFFSFFCSCDSLKYVESQSYGDKLRDLLFSFSADITEMN